MKEAMRALFRIWGRSEQMALGAAGIIFISLLLTVFLRSPAVSTALHAIAFLFIAFVMVFTARRIRIQADPERYRAEVARARVVLMTAMASSRRWLSSANDAGPVSVLGAVSRPVSTKHAGMVPAAWCAVDRSRRRKSRPDDFLRLAIECARRDDWAEALSTLSLAESRLRVAGRDQDLLLLLRALAFNALGQRQRALDLLSRVRRGLRSPASELLAAELRAESGGDRARISDALKALSDQMEGLS